MLRLFVAVDLPAPVRQAAAELCAGLSGARFVNPHQLHVTLRFMGQTPDQDLAAIRERLAGVQAAAFSLRLQGVGTFPAGVRRAHVLWLGLEPAQPLRDLALAIAGQLGDLGLGANERGRPFSPHLTLARFGCRPPGDELASFLEEHSSFRSPEWKVECFRLYSSTLHANGATHDVLATYPLGTICRVG
jgi:RNA 2',3'-cyclic 3'-phosphodiesterase